MRLITCKQGHRFDPDLTAECPECVMMENLGITVEDREKTVDLDLKCNLRTCPAGHLYDAFLTPACPVCAMEEQTIPGRDLGVDPWDDVLMNVPWASCPRGHMYPADLDGCPECAKEGFFTEEPAVKRRPVGWLVALSGADYGGSWEVYEENNFLGTGPDNDIILTDALVSRRKHCAITYDPEDRKYYIGMVEGRNIVRLNDRPVLMPMELHSHDRIRIGKTVLLFIPLCDDRFDWKDWPAETPEIPG